MANKENDSPKTDLFKQVLRGNIAGDRVEVPADGLSSEMSLLRGWQVARLQSRYADFIENPDYKPTADFFMSEIYGARDFSQRDADAESVYNTMRKYLPQRLLVTMGLAIELNRLTDALDNYLLTVLINQVGMSDTLTTTQYAEAYRLCNNYDDRRRQIDTVLSVGEGVDKLTRIPMIGMILRAARRPARRYGWIDLHQFLENGFRAFKQMPDAARFLSAVGRRERRILDQIFNQSENPMEINDE